mgnify:CR=1 FL=1
MRWASALTESLIVLSVGLEIPDLEATCKKALSINSRDLPASMRLADFYWQQHCFESALDVALTAALFEPESFHLHKILASSYIELDRFAEALVHAHQMRNLKPPSWTRLRVLVQCLCFISFFPHINKMRLRMIKAIDTEVQSNNQWANWASSTATST